MQTLFAISVVCFLALVWAGIAVARHIRNGHKLNASDVQSGFAQHLFQASAETTLTEPRSVRLQNIRDITAKKSWNQPPEVITVRPSPELRLNPDPFAAESFDGKRKSPQPSHQSGSERLDWAYFNKDFGDLTDPYETPRLRANSRTLPKRY